MAGGWDDASARAALREMFEAGVRAADPLTVLAPHLPEPTADGRVVVVGVGKAAAKMALAVEQAWPGLPLSGLVIAPHGADIPDPPPVRRIPVRFGNHPVPDAAGAAAAAEILAAVQGLSARDLVLFLVSGGGSSLSTLPAPGLTLDDLVAVNRELLRCGAPIDAMNCIRKHLSAFSGGRVAAAAHPARVVTLAISDVPGDDPAVIASGPTIADPTSFAEARALVAHYRMRLPEAALRHLERAAEETPKPGDPRLANTELRMIATPMLALRAMAEEARAMGLAPLILGDALEGEARELGRVLGGIALSAATHGVPVGRGAVLLSGGETTVTIDGAAGEGGRGTETLLGLALALNGAAGIWSLCCDTDGIDGKSDAAGAIATPDTLARARALGRDPRAALAGHDSTGLFRALGDLVVTGPTLTNVNDVRAVLIA
ncbi:glycerate kinase type-2 family protein [Paracraurococcus ruber]|uniref:Glycerate kinase n=1 Tax=Paracraurococcus ruber TaxID=77675 RepID=A0ABS1CRH3_9PROT|nr:glycerate kinase [Paracraurococcus ruber]MBK1657045.1 glycerate kinase [Paracraurococcus ruber]TDG31477.1 glycerate kinase [Paracraurococcus ruber]